MSSNPSIGSSFDDFLLEEGIYEQVNEVALKRVLVWQLEQGMQEAGISKAAMAERMGTSRQALDRLLDPNNPAVTLKTLVKAANCLGKRLHIELQS